MDSDWERWEKRYSGEGYHFGTAPALFVTAHAGRIPDASRVLAIADGEGRNSVHLARLGHRVTAFDPVPAALGKARQLASAEGVDVTYLQADIDSWTWEPGAFDAVLAVFVQFASPSFRTRMFERMARTLRPGGLLLLHGYAPRQVEYGTGGPPIVEHMYTLPFLHDAFPGWEVVAEADYDAEIHEGDGHSGLSGLIDFVARKPELAA